MIEANKVKQPREKTKLKPTLVSVFTFSVQTIARGITSNMTSVITLKMVVAAMNWSVLILCLGVVRLHCAFIGIVMNIWAVVIEIAKSV